MKLSCLFLPKKNEISLQNYFIIAVIMLSITLCFLIYSLAASDGAAAGQEYTPRCVTSPSQVTGHIRDCRGYQ